jgi:hypothetical protein
MRQKRANLERSEMVELLASLYSSGSVLSAVESESGVTLPPLGYIVLGLILVPVAFLVTMAIVSGPKNWKVPGLFVLCMGMIVGATVVGLAAAGSLLGLLFTR